MTSHQVFNHPRTFPQTCAGPSCSKESLFSRGRLEGLERSLLAAMPGERFLDHSDRLEPPRLSHSRPWLLKHLHCVGYGRDHRQVAIEANCNWTEGPHSCRSPRLNAAKREDKGSGCMNVDHGEFKEPLADAIEAEQALLGPGSLPRRTILLVEQQDPTGKKHLRTVRRREPFFEFVTPLARQLLKYTATNSATVREEMKRLWSFRSAVL
ncbi:hypothetical protein NKH82_12905 [Mesorhizobium sp. M0915]